MSLQAAKTFFVALGEIFAFWKKTQKADSFISYTQTTRVEPIVMLDERVLYVSYLNDVMQTALSIFAGWYLQAAAISVNVGKINVGKMLGHLNPERSVLESRNDALEYACGAALESADFRFGLPSSKHHISLENLSNRLPTALESADGRMGPDAPYPAHYGSRPFNPDIDPDRSSDEHKRQRSAQETLAGFNRAFDGAKSDFDKGDQRGSNQGGYFTGDERNEQKFGFEIGKEIREAANMAVGRVFTVDISDGGHKASIPVMIRLLAHRVAPELLVHILSDGARVRTSTSKERWFGYQLGELKFWRDIVACRDLIAEHKKALLADKSGVYHTIVKRRQMNSAVTTSSVTGGTDGYSPSVGTASNIVVVSRQTIRELEKEIGGKFDNFRVRQKVFQNTGLIMVIVIDAADDHVTYYHRDIELSTDLTASQVKAAGKGSGPDVSDILKAFTLGQAPGAGGF